MYMKRVAIAAAAALWCCAAAAEEWRPAEWPVLRHYDGDHLYRIALPLGGIGTGTVSLGGRGELRDWEIMNVPAKGYSTVTTGNDAPFFAVYAAPEGGEAVTLLAAGPLYDHEILHYEGRAVNHHGMPRFGEASFDAAYPFGQVHLSGGGAPLEVTVRGFNPFVPCDADASSLPVAVLVYEVENISGKDMDVAVCGCMRNFIGKDGSRFYTDWKGDCIPTGAAANRNEYRDNGILDIDADVIVQKATHKPIVLGKGGAMIKRIAEYAREDLEKMTGSKIYLTLWVRVKEDWRDDTVLLNNLGYDPKKDS